MSTNTSNGSHSKPCCWGMKSKLRHRDPHGRGDNSPFHLSQWDHQQVAYPGLVVERRLPLPYHTSPDQIPAQIQCYLWEWHSVSMPAGGRTPLYPNNTRGLNKMCRIAKISTARYHQNLACYHWLSVPGNFIKIANCGILFNMLIGSKKNWQRALNRVDNSRWQPRCPWV